MRVALFSSALSAFLQEACIEHGPQSLANGEPAHTGLPQQYPKSTAGESNHG